MTKTNKVFLWDEIDAGRREEYQNMIVSFASLTELFAQKDDGKSGKNGPTAKKKTPQKPFISSKFQETVFKHAFDASIEDIGNTSYDASLDPEVAGKPKNKNSTAKADNKRYLFGIKTFLINNPKGKSFQKIAQFKAIAESLESADGNSWGEIITKIRKNAKKCNTEEEILKVNESLYKELAQKIAEARNERINSSKALIKKRLNVDNPDFKAVYHFLMPSIKKGKDRVIYLGETPYEEIGKTIEILGITDENHPTNFSFKDEYNNEYKYTSADSQLYMKFKHEPFDTWPVEFLENPYDCFRSFFEQMAREEKKKDDFESDVQEDKSFSFLIQLEKFSGFNNFFGLKNKLGPSGSQKTLANIKSFARKYRETKLNDLAKKIEKYLNDQGNPSPRKRDKIIEKMKLAINQNQDDKILKDLARNLNDFLDIGTDAPYSFAESKRIKDREFLTNSISELKKENDGTDLQEYEKKVEQMKTLLWRTPYEMYIRLPISFHREHPDFFGKKLFEYDQKGKFSFIGKRENFDISFGSSGKEIIKMHLTQSYGKGLQSSGTQTKLGEWILKDVFQLKKWEPLTEWHLKKAHINGFRLKKDSDELIHFEFIWIDVGDPPIDFWGGKD